MHVRPRSRASTAAIAGAALIAFFAALDAALGESAVLIPLLISGPLAAAFAAETRHVMALAAIAVVVALALGPVDGIAGTTTHAVEVFVVAAGGIFAVAAADARRRFEAALEAERTLRVRSDFLARVGRLLEEPLDPERRLERVVQLAIPDVADLCLVDVLDPDGRLRGLAVAATDPAVAERLRESRRHAPPDPGGEHPVALAARRGEPVLRAQIDPAAMLEKAPADEHLRTMHEVGYRSAMNVPLVARGRSLGVLSFVRLGDDAVRYGPEDLDMAIEAARRASLALDNARLFDQLSRAERQLEAVLQSLVEAVTVQRPDHSLLYVNAAAAELLECDSPAEVLSTPLPEILARFVALDEDGSPFDYGRLPGRYALAGEAAPEPVVMRSISRATGRERWMLVKSTPVRDERGEVTMAVNIMEDVTEARRAERQQRFLASASKLVSASLDVEETVRHLADAIVPEIGDWCIVDMPDDRGVPRPVTVAHADDDRRALLAEMRERHPPGDHEAGPAGVMRHGRPQLFENVDETTVAGYAAGERHFELMRELGTRSLAVVPLSAGDRALGAITVGTAESGRRLTEVDLALLAEVGRRAGIAVENARVHEARTRIAVTLQRSLLPPRLPIVPGLTIAARFRAAGITSEVGGDFYDLFPAGDAWMVVIGDVTGKGPEAAAITSLARYTMRTASVYESSPAAVLHRLNEALAADPERRRLCTVLCLRLERDGDGPLRGTLAAGGHPLPFLVGPDGAAPVGRPGPLLGAFEGSHWRESAVDLPEGTSLVLYTDGVTDTRGLDGRFGDARLASVLASARGLDADEVASRIDAALLDFQQGPQPDDVALLVLRSGRPPDARGNGGMPAGPARG